MKNTLWYMEQRSACNGRNVDLLEPYGWVVNIPNQPNINAEVRGCPISKLEQGE